MEGNVEVIIYVGVLALGEEIIVKLGRRSSDQFVRVKRLAKMELVLNPRALVNARKVGQESSVIRGRIKREETQQKRKIAVKLR